MIYPLYPYDILGDCTAIQPLKSDKRALLGLGRKGVEGPSFHEFKLAIPDSDTDRKASWNMFFETTITHGADAFGMVLATLQGPKLRAVTFSDLNKDLTLDDGVWTVKIKLRDLGVELTCIDDPLNGLSVEGYDDAEVNGRILSYRLNNNIYVGKICSGPLIYWPDREFTYEGELR